jgi:hypothetical protein
MLHRNMNSRFFAHRCQNNDGSTGSGSGIDSRMLPPVRHRWGQFQINNSLEQPAPTRASRESGFSSMPRYFFNTRIGDELISDPEGEELRNPDRAWEIARAMIRELLKTEDAERGLLNAVLEVTDDEGEIVLEFPFAEAILGASNQPTTKH